MGNGTPSRGSATEAVGDGCGSLELGDGLPAAWADPDTDTSAETGRSPSVRARGSALRASVSSRSRRHRRFGPRVEIAEGFPGGVRRDDVLGRFADGEPPAIGAGARLDAGGFR